MLRDKWYVLRVCIACHAMLGVLIWCGNIESATRSQNSAQAQDRCACGRRHGILRSPFLRQHEHARDYIFEVFRDVLALHRNIIDFDTLKVFGSLFPAWVAARMSDEHVQSHFYCRKHHKNINQFGWWCHDGARLSVGIPIAALGSMAFLSNDDDFRTTSYVFLLGMPFVIFGKDVLKKLKLDACRRPWNEHFDCNQRALGGCPSGHMAEATYMAVLYGKRFGPYFGIPLGAVALTVGACFLNCNRHYLSQLIAGAGLGVTYALAADKLIDAKLRNDVRFTFYANPQGNPQIGVQCSF